MSAHADIMLNFDLPAQQYWCDDDASKIGQQYNSDTHSGIVERCFEQNSTLLSETFVCCALALSIQDKLRQIIHEGGW